MTSYDVRFISSFFHTEEEEYCEDYEIEKIRFCDFFLDRVVCFIEKNKGSLWFENFYQNFFNRIPKRTTFSDIIVYYAPITIVCCSKALYNPPYLDDTNEEKMDEECLAAEIDYHCLHYLSCEHIFSAICDNCKKNLIIDISRKRFHFFNLKGNNDKNS